MFAPVQAVSPSAPDAPGVTRHEAAAMDEAIALARRGAGRVHPNPLVGAVVLRGDQIVGRGWHAGYGAEHAEPMALREAGEAARGATLVVTLEPCAHHGKTPPCVDAIVAAGIARVVIGIHDPNPIAQGGADTLRAAGLDVHIGVASERIRHDNFRFLHSLQHSPLPFVTVKLAVSLDGCVADQFGASKWLSGESARRWVHRLRAEYAAVGVGGRTALQDDVRLTVRGEIVPRIAPTRVIFDRSGRLPATHGIFRQAGDVPVVIITGSHHATGDVTEHAGVSWIRATSLHDGLQQLASRQIDSLLVEGGGRLAGALWRDGLINRIHQVVAPLWLGKGVPAWDEIGNLTIDSTPRWRLIDVTRIDEDTILTLEKP